MRRAALLLLAALTPAAEPFQEATVALNARLTYPKGSHILILDSSAGSTYLLRTSLRDQRSLQALASQLTLPLGWHSTVSQLDQDLLISRTTAQVLTDNRGNSYLKVTAQHHWFSALIEMPLRWLGLDVHPHPADYF
jgi:hypothetical protein